VTRFSVPGGLKGKAPEGRWRFKKEEGREGEEKGRRREGKREKGWI
jgi:hypothetical protein